MRVRYRGPFEVDAAYGVCSTAFALAASQGSNAILIDGLGVRGTPPTTMELFKLGKHVSDLRARFGRSVRIAVVGDLAKIDPQNFGETVARNRGANLKVFTDMENAIRWLDR